MSSSGRLSAEMMMMMRIKLAISSAADNHKAKETD